MSPLTPCGVSPGMTMPSLTASRIAQPSRRRTDGVAHEGARDREKKGARIMKSPILYLALERRNSDRAHARVHSARSLLADLRDLAPDITSRAAEIEAARRLPPDLVDALRSIGIFRMLVPQSHGGLELDLPVALEVIGALARIEGSVGWTVAIASGGDLFAPLLQRETYDEIYRNGPDAILAGSSQPAGTAEAVAAGLPGTGPAPVAPRRPPPQRELVPPP